MSTPTLPSPRIIHAAPLKTRMLQGAGIAFVLIAIYVSGLSTKPEFGQFWRLRPLFVVTFAGAMGGVFYYLMDHLRGLGGWKTLLAAFISLLGYVIALWMGTVLGLVGTYWN